MRPSTSFLPRPTVTPSGGRCFPRFPRQTPSAFLWADRLPGRHSVHGLLPRNPLIPKHHPEYRNMFRGGFLWLFANRRTTLRGVEGISSSLQRRAHSRASQPLNTADRPTSHNGPIMRSRCTWVFASARSFNRNPSVRRASLSLRSQAPPFAGSRTPTAPGLEGRHSSMSAESTAIR